MIKSMKGEKFMRKLSRRAASIVLAAAMLFTTAGVSQKKVEAASTGKLSVTGYQDYSDAQKILKEVNKYRKKNGRKALKMDRGLTNSASMRGFETTIYIPETSPHRRQIQQLCVDLKQRSIFQKQVRIEDQMESFQKVSTRRSSMKTAHNPQELHRSRS